MYEMTAEKFTQLENSAKAGNADAQYELAGYYDIESRKEVLGQVGTVNNRAKAAQWYEKAAMQGHSGAQHALYGRYKDGDGVPKDPAKADYWFQQYLAGNKEAAEKGDTDAMYTMADIYIGEKPDYAKAKYWYDQYSSRVEKGADVARSTTLGMRLEELRRAEEEAALSPEEKRSKLKEMEADAEKGDPQAQFELADAYLNGLYVDKSYKKAKYWYDKVQENSESLPVDIQNEIFFMSGKLERLRQDEKWNQMQEKPAAPKPATPKPSAPKPAVSRPKASVDWSAIMIEIIAIAAAFIFLKGSPLYSWTMEHHRELNTLQYLLYQLASIVAAAVGGAVALGLALSFSEGLIIVGGIAGLIGGLITIFCHDIPSVYSIAKTAALAVMVLAVIQIVITLFKGMGKR